MSEVLPRHEWWRRAYEADRYMRGLSDEEIDLRFADILTNQAILTAEGKIGVSGIQWLEKGTHLHAELSIRGRGFPDAVALGSRLAIPRPARSILGEKVRDRFPDGIPNRFVLFKYGKQEHLKKLLKHGHLRLSPASAYSDPSLNVAVADNELHFEKINGEARTHYTQQGDFYCFCSAWLHSDRLFSDFEATAILIVSEPHEFFLRLATALDRRHYQILFNRVTYIDPLLLGDIHVTDLAFVKHMRFAYQFEHRWIAAPPTPRMRLNRIDLNLGSIEDIAELYHA